MRLHSTPLANFTGGSLDKYRGNVFHFYDLLRDSLARTHTPSENAHNAPCGWQAGAKDICGFVTPYNVRQVRCHFAGWNVNKKV